MCEPLTVDKIHLRVDLIQFFVYLVGSLTCSIERRIFFWSPSQILFQVVAIHEDNLVIPFKLHP